MCHLWCNLMKKGNACNSLSFISSRFSCLSRFASSATVCACLEIISILEPSLLIIYLNYVNSHITLISWPPTFILFESPFLLFIRSLGAIFLRRWIQRQSSALYALSCQTLFCRTATQLFYVAWYKELWVIGRNVHLLLQYNQHLPLTSWATQ